MKLSFCLFVCMTMAIGNLKAQTLPLKRLQAVADSLYGARNFALCGEPYMQQIPLSDFPRARAGAAYNACCCFALNGKPDSALLAFDLAVKMGYNNLENIASDSDLNSLRNLPQFQTSLARIPKKKPVNNNPKRLKLVTQDIRNFWQAYDLAKGDSAALQQHMRAIYFAQASTGMNDYMSMKVGTINRFVQHLQKHPKFYATVRANTLAPEQYARQMKASFKALKKWYPETKFPDVYFIMGAFSSGGTVSENGLLIGINQMSGGPGVDVSEVDRSTTMLMHESRYLPNIVAHELIHFQQDGLKSESTNLKYVILEGMADFLGELISGTVGNPHLHKWMKGREKQVWAKFIPTMYENNYNAWIANAGDMPEGEMADQGYWIGYEICKAYFEQATDKKKAIHDMLNIQDYKAFWEQSKMANKIQQLH